MTTEPNTEGHDPLTVPCPSCLAPAATDTTAGVPCDHTDRVPAARVAAAVEGVCGLCGDRLVRLTHPDEAVHPTENPTCPPMPDPTTDWNGYAAALNAGVRLGYPGIENFVPAPEAPSAAHAAASAGATSLGGLPLCPECAQGKVLNCAQQALNDLDGLVPCANAGRQHQ